MKMPTTAQDVVRYLQPWRDPMHERFRAGALTPADVLREQLHSVTGTLPPEMAVALIRNAAAQQSGVALVTLAQDRLVNLSNSELLQIAALLTPSHPEHAAWLRGLAADPSRTRVYPGASSWGHTICDAWQHENSPARAPGRKKSARLPDVRRQSSKKLPWAQALAQQGDLQAGLEPGCSIATRDPAARAALQGALAKQGLAASLYAALTLRRDVLSGLPFDLFYRRMGEVTAALVGASLQVGHRGDVWQRTLRTWLLAHDDASSLEMVAALMPHGRAIVDLRDLGSVWMAWLCDLHGLWRKSAPQCQTDLRRFAEQHPLQVALALSALHAVAAHGTDGWDVVLLLERLDATSLDACIEALVDDAPLRRRLRDARALERSELQNILVEHHADLRLASTLQHALHLSELGAAAYRKFRDARAGALKAAPEVALLLACIADTVGRTPSDGADAAAPEVRRTRLTQMLYTCGSDLELIEIYHPELREGIVEKAPVPLPSEPVVHAFLAPNPGALWAVRPGSKHTITRYQVGCLQQLKAAVMQENIDPARVRQVFAGSRPAQRETLREAICADADNLLWPLFALNAAAGPGARRKLESGLPLLDAICDTEQASRQRFEDALEAGLHPIEAAHAAQLGGLVAGRGAATATAAETWRRSLEAMGQDAAFSALAILGQDAVWLREFCDKAARWGFFGASQTHVKLAPRIQAIAQVEDDSAGKLTELQGGNVEAVTEVLFRAPSLLRRLIAQRGQRSRAHEDEAAEASDDEAETFGDFLLVGLDVASQRLDRLADISQSIVKQRVRLLEPGFPGPQGRFAEKQRAGSDTAGADLIYEARVWKFLQTTAGWLGKLPDVVGLRPQTSEAQRRRDVTYASLLLALPEDYAQPLHAVADLTAFTQASRRVCHDMGRLHGLGLMSHVPGSQSEPTFGISGLCGAAVLRPVDQLLALLDQAQDSRAALYSGLVKCALRAWVTEATQWAQKRGATQHQLCEALVAGLSAYLAAFTEKAPANCHAFVRQAVAWEPVAGALLGGRTSPGIDRGLRLMADYAVLLRP